MSQYPPPYIYQKKPFVLAPLIFFHLLDALTQLSSRTILSPCTPRPPCLYFFVGNYNQIQEKTRYPVTFLSTPSIDFKASAAGSTERNKYFLSGQISVGLFRTNSSFFSFKDASVSANIHQNIAKYVYCQICCQIFAAYFVIIFVSQNIFTVAK